MKRVIWRYVDSKTEAKIKSVLFERTLEMIYVQLLRVYYI